MLIYCTFGKFKRDNALTTATWGMGGGKLKLRSLSATRLGNNFEKILNIVFNVTFETS